MTKPLRRDVLLEAMERHALKRQQPFFFDPLQPPDGFWSTRTNVWEQWHYGNLRPWVRYRAGEQALLDLQDGLDDEIERRVEAYERGELKTVDAEEVFAKAERKYGP